MENNNYLSTFQLRVIILPISFAHYACRDSDDEEIVKVLSVILYYTICIDGNNWKRYKNFYVIFSLYIFVLKKIRKDFFINFFLILFRLSNASDFKMFFVVVILCSFHLQVPFLIFHRLLLHSIMLFLWKCTLNCAFKSFFLHCVFWYANQIVINLGNLSFLYA